MGLLDVLFLGTACLYTATSYKIYATSSLKLVAWSLYQFKLITSLMRSYFRNSTIFAICCFVAALALGFASGGWAGWLSTLFIVMVLGALETSISFDNAIVNTTVLKRMNDIWRHRFLTRGILIAVVGMRVLFPLLIVSIFGHIDPVEALKLALFDATNYGEVLHKAHIPILGFGWAFLMMVGLRYFFNPKKQTHRLGFVEHYLTKMGKMEAIEAAVVLMIVYIFSQHMPHQSTEFFVSGVLGVVLYIAVDGLSALLESDGGHLAKSSAMAFLYLEVLDASFSLDGVIGAFALSTNLIVIALWLGIGAFYVRSMTIYLYEKGTLQAYKYLEHGAFWAICLLALMMFCGAIIHIPEVITWLVGVLVIALSIWSSIRETKKAKKTETAEKAIMN